MTHVSFLALLAVSLPCFALSQDSLSATTWDHYATLVREAETVSRPPLEARGADGMDVVQRQAAVRLSGGAKRYLQTEGAGPCVVLTLHHPASQTAALAHLDANTDVKASVAAMLDAMGTPPQEVDARLIGGLKGLLSEEVFLAAIEALDARRVSIREATIKSVPKTRRYVERVVVR